MYRPGGFAKRNLLVLLTKFGLVSAARALGEYDALSVLRAQSNMFNQKRWEP